MLLSIMYFNLQLKKGQNANLYSMLHNILRLLSARKSFVFESPKKVRT